eukprot:4608639-Pyramimonas_sp.AAC.1
MSRAWPVGAPAVVLLVVLLPHAAKCTVQAPFHRGVHMQTGCLAPHPSHSSGLIALRHRNQAPPCRTPWAPMPRFLHRLVWYRGFEVERPVRRAQPCRPDAQDAMPMGPRPAAR